MSGRVPLRDQEFEELCLRAYTEAENTLDAMGALPRQEGLLSRFRRGFEFMAAIQLGLLVACVSVMLNFMIIVMILHLDLSGYLGLLKFGG